jgi:hypothetical protein
MKLPNSCYTRWLAINLIELIEFIRARVRDAGVRAMPL